jgi:hypothetical protein
MFEIKPETREEAIVKMRAAIPMLPPHVTDEMLGEAFDAAVEIVKKQFGM